MKNEKNLLKAMRYDERVLERKFLTVNITQYDYRSTFKPKR